MGLFLLGIPCAIVMAKVLHDDIKYTSTDLKTQKAPRNFSEQCKQIDKDFINILQYCGAKCNIKKIGYDRYEIKDAKKNQYGGMERYLASKGYSLEAIQYAKDKYNNIAYETHKKEEQKRNRRINDFEKKLLSTETQSTVIKNNICNVCLPQTSVENEIKKLITYFKKHNNDVQCNIIMGGSEPYHNHQEVWHINKPIGTDVCQYYWDVCDKLDIKWKN